MLIQDMLRDQREKIQVNECVGLLSARVTNCRLYVKYGTNRIVQVSSSEESQTKTFFDDIF